MSQHAVLSPSGAETWMTCAGSAAMQKGIPDESSEYSDEGTAAHLLASESLEHQRDPTMFLGETILVGTGEDFDGAIWGQDLLHSAEPFTTRRTYVVDQTMADHVAKYVDAIRGDVGIDGVLVGEQRIAIGQWTGEPDAHGTSDACITRPGTLAVHDLKYGMGHKVSAVENKQMMIYALGLRDEMDITYGPFEKIVLSIHQPRLDHVSTWECTSEELDAFGAEVKARAARALALYEQSDPKTLGGMVINNYQPALVASEDGCRWCKAKATCPAIAKAVADATSDDYSVIDLDAQQLADKMAKVPLVEQWCKAIRAKLDSEILSGKSIPGWKIVMGKKGNRQWTDEAAADRIVKRFLSADERYTKTFISATQAEKLLKPKAVTPKVWEKLNKLITQKPGGPSVAPESDSRPQWVSPDTTDDFDVIPPTEVASLT